MGGRGGFRYWFIFCLYIFLFGKVRLSVVFTIVIAIRPVFITVYFGLMVLLIVPSVVPIDFPVIVVVRVLIVVITSVLIIVVVVGPASLAVIILPGITITVIVVVVLAGLVVVTSVVVSIAAPWLFFSFVLNILGAVLLIVSLFEGTVLVTTAESSLVVLLAFTSPVPPTAPATPPPPPTTTVTFIILSISTIVSLPIVIATLIATIRLSLLEVRWLTIATSRSRLLLLLLGLFFRLFIIWGISIAAITTALLCLFWFIRHYPGCFDLLIRL